MKLQFKLLLALGSGLLVVYAVSSAFQCFLNLNSIQRLAQSNRSSEESRQWEWIDRLETAANASLSTAMAEGDMDKFGRILANQRNVSGLRDLSLYSTKGRVAYSSTAGNARRELSPALTQQLFSAGEIVRQRTDTSFECYRPLKAEKACLECHTDWRLNQVCGVMGLSFSADSLKEAEQQWLRFESDFRRSNVSIALTAGLVLTLVIAGLATACVRRFVCKPLKRTTGTLAIRAVELSKKAEAVEVGGHALARDAAQQAESLESTGAALNQITAMTQRNAESAGRAKALSRQTSEAAEEGASRMREMNAAMEGIKASSDDIGKILKSINEIAFQTNLLALNAAVEAARAGDAGLGFAVVADEVRSLARRSAEAARETAEKAQGAASRTAQGVELGRQIGSVLEKILTRAREVDAVAAQVATASQEQSQGLTQVGKSIQQLDRITQSNSAQATQNAKVGEELQGQAEGLQRAISEVMGLIGESDLPARSQPQLGPVLAPVVPAVKPITPPKPNRKEYARTGRADEVVAEWDEKRMASGNADIDAQHQELIAMINHLHQASRAGAAKTELKKMLAFLAAYVETHFAHEEELMEQQHCPTREQNKKAHAEFLKRFSEFRREFETSGANELLVARLETMVIRWLTNHICSIDTGLRQCGAPKHNGRSHGKQIEPPPAPSKYS